MSATAGTCPDCGKVRYATRAVAKRFARSRKHRDGRLRAYQCGGYFHLTSMPAKSVQWFRERKAD